MAGIWQGSFLAHVVMMDFCSINSLLVNFSFFLCLTFFSNKVSLIENNFSATYSGFATIHHLLDHFQDFSVSVLLIFSRDWLSRIHGLYSQDFSSALSPTPIVTNRSIFSHCLIFPRRQTCSQLRSAVLGKGFGCMPKSKGQIEGDTQIPIMNYRWANKNPTNSLTDWLMGRTIHHGEWGVLYKKGIMDVVQEGLLWLKKFRELLKDAIGTPRIHT